MGAHTKLVRSVVSSSYCSAYRANFVSFALGTVTLDPLNSAKKKNLKKNGCDEIVLLLRDAHGLDADRRRLHGTKITFSLTEKGY